MEKQPHQEYRDELASKLKGIRNDSESKNPRKEASDHLDEEKKSPEYQEALSFHPEEIKDSIKLESKLESDEVGSDLEESLWKSFEPNLEEQSERDWKEFLLNPLYSNSTNSSLNSTPVTLEEYRDKWVNSFADRAVLEAFDATKKELGGNVLLKLSEPSRFEVMYKEAALKHISAFKREHSSEYNDEVTKVNLDREYFDYDMEKDIRETEEKEKNELANKFKLEMLYWSALEEGRLEESSKILSVIELDRKSAPENLQLEALTWRANLSLQINDVEMFKTVFHKIRSKSDQLQDFRGSMANGVEKIVASNLLEGIEVKLSDFKLDQEHASGENREKYLDGLIHDFLQETYLEIVDKLSDNPDIDLLLEAKLIFSEKREKFLKTNPIFEDILFLEKTE